MDTISAPGYQHTHAFRIPPTYDLMESLRQYTIRHPDRRFRPQAPVNGRPILGAGCVGKRAESEVHGVGDPGDNDGGPASQVIRYL